MGQVSTYAVSDVGLVRTNNEDAYFVDPERGLVIVADGMGGHAAGEVASQLTIETISKQVTPSSSIWPFGKSQRERELLIRAIREANERVRAAASEDETRRGMGTTVVVLWIRGRRAHVAHVGDSRIYRYRGGGLVQLTQDHSWPSEDGGMRNVLTRAVGAEDNVEVDHRIVEISGGDVFLLCSDGLTRTVDDGAIVRTLQECHDAEAVAARLIELAKANGAPDNVTVALAYC
ncbi:MAG: PP2C family protein-serine/threonine phosphatase [Candidatus Binatia bacterium]